MEIIRVYADTTGFNEVYEGYIRSQLERLIVDEAKSNVDEIEDRKEVDT